MSERAAPPLRTRGRNRESPFSTAGLVAVALVGALLVWLAGHLLLLTFAGVLLAIFLRAAAQVVSRVTRLPSGWSLSVVVLLLLGSAIGGGSIFAPQLGEQAQELSEAIPRAFSQLTDRLRETSWGSWLLDQATRNEPGQQDGAVVERAATAASRAFDAIIAVVIVLFVGLYLAADPQPYVRGVLRLVPLHRRRRAAEVLYAAGYQLRWWLVGQLLAMIVVGLMMGIGLAIIGVPLAFALGVLAGLLEFIPTIGPPLALVPAVLLALVDTPEKAVYVLILYGIVQTVESYLLTPLVQQRAVHLLPVVTITAQVFFAWTAGAIGLLVAVPLVAAVQTSVQMWYVEDFLSDRMTLQAEKDALEELEQDGILAEPSSSGP